MAEKANKGAPKKSLESEETGEIEEIQETEDPTIPFLPSFSKPPTTRKRTPLIFDLSLSTFLSLLFTPKALLDSRLPFARRYRRTNVGGANETEGRLLEREDASELSELGLPLPFNLASGSNRPARLAGTVDTVPGALAGDW